MSDIMSSDGKKPMEQPEHDLSKAMGQLSVTTDDSDKTSLSLSDMPIDVVGPIIEKLDYRHQLRLRKVSKSLRALVDKQKPACERIEVECYKKCVYIAFNEYVVIYRKNVNEDVEGTRIINEDFKINAFNDLASTLKNPKLQLDEFRVIFEACDEEEISTYYNNLQYALEPLNHQLSVKKVVLDVLTPPNLLSILSCLKPGFLKNISIWVHDETREINWRIDSTGMNQVALLDQWRQAEELELQYSFDRFPLEYAKNFKRFRIYEDEMDGDVFIRIKDFLSELDNFEHCILSCLEFSEDSDLVYELLGAPVSSNATEEIFHQHIPDSDYYLEFTKPTETDDVFIVKKKREVN